MWGKEEMLQLRFEGKEIANFAKEWATKFAFLPTQQKSQETKTFLSSITLLTILEIDQGTVLSPWIASKEILESPSTKIWRKLSFSRMATNYRNRSR